MKYLVTLTFEDDKNPEPIDPNELETWATTVTRAAAGFTGMKAQLLDVERIPET